MRNPGLAARTTRIAWLVLLIVLLLVTARESVASSADDARLLESIHKQENAFFQSMERKERNGFLSSFGELLDAESKLMTMRVGKKTYDASSAYLATELKNDYECVYFVADDTIHTTEGLKFVTVPWQPGQKLLVHTVWPANEIEQINFYTGDPGEMHQNAYKNVHKLPFDTQSGLLDYKPSYETGHQLVFAIVKVKNDKFYRKFVFVMGAPKS